ncbi:MAG: hypothetical protein WDN24_18355 [Sphingomonas sp.]
MPSLNRRLSLILMTSCAGAALSACDGAVSVGSPGEGVIVVPAPAPAAPTPSPSPTYTPGTPAISCPGGTTDVGVIGSFRGCRLPSLITGSTTLAKIRASPMRSTAASTWASTSAAPAPRRAAPARS